jgi:hypothetical protein
MLPCQFHLEIDIHVSPSGDSATKMKFIALSFRMQMLFSSLVPLATGLSRRLHSNLTRAQTFIDLSSALIQILQ